MSRYGVKRIVARNDVVIIQAQFFMKYDEIKKIRDEVMKQIKEDGFAFLPPGFKATVIRRNKIYLLPKKENDMARYIDADAVIKTIEKVDDYGDGIAYEVLGHAIRDVALLPTADVRPNVHGEWIKESGNCVMGEGYMWFCSRCQNRVYVDTNGRFPKFCDECGADMRGGNE